MVVYIEKLKDSIKKYLLKLISDNSKVSGYKVKKVICFPIYQQLTSGI